MAVKKQTPVLNDSEAIMGYVCGNWDNSGVHEYESAYVAYLDRENRLIEWQLFNIGDRNSCDIDVREIMRHCVKLNASGLILAHNHPIGTTYPSDEDIMATEIMFRHCAFLGIAFIDHIIISPQSKPYSFAEAKRMDGYASKLRKINDMFEIGTFPNVALSIVEDFCVKSKAQGTPQYQVKQATENLIKVYTKFYDPII